MIGFELVPDVGVPEGCGAPTCLPEPVGPATPPPAGRLVRDLRSGLQVRLTEAAGRARAAVAGEIDLDCAPLLERVLRESLRGAPGGLDVDLLGVDFLDCSGLNVLLRVRADAVEAGLSMKVTGMSPVVRRVLELTGSAALFA